MDSRDFIKNIVGENILKDNQRAYKEILEKVSLEEVTDDYWNRVIPFYKSLNEDHKKLIFEVIRQVQIDAASTIFSYIDGISFLDNQEGDFELKYEAETLSGDLQDTLLSMDEDGDL